MKACPTYSIVQNHNSPCPDELFGQMVAIPVRFFTTDGDDVGIIEVHRDVAADVGELFSFMWKIRFPLSSVLPIAFFGWDDECSMAANNTSGFNYRMIAGTDRLSNHAYGRAIDINPRLNPYIRENIVQPPGAVYDPSRPGTLTADSLVTRWIKEHGWNWGGDWKSPSPKDYQHFEKPAR